MYPLQWHNKDEVYQPLQKTDMRGHMADLEHEAAMEAASARVGHAMAGSSAHAAPYKQLRWLSNSPFTWTAPK